MNFQMMFAATTLALMLLYLDVAAGFTSSSRPGLLRLSHLRIPYGGQSRLFESQWDDDDVTAAAAAAARSTTQRNKPIGAPIGSSKALERPRTVDRMEKFSRLPVWPAWNGVLIFVVSRLLGEEVAAKLEHAIGGRVCPNFFVAEQTSPFIMLVHHCHSFAPYDPLRFFQRTFFPEGFPAHPHRGFVTVTYFVKGGFSHRDSMGVKQMYGAESRHDGKHTQWLTTGAGVLHEEMFDFREENSGLFGFLQPSSQELYQLWLNVPASHKLDDPSVDLLGGPDETPLVEVVGEDGSKTETLVLAGDYRGKQSTAPLVSPVALFHVRMEPGSTWRHDLPTNFQTAMIYLRSGSVSVGDERIPPHYTAYLSSGGTQLAVTTSDEPADFMFLAGQPLNEPVSAQGSMVMNSPDEINHAYADYQVGRMGRPWDHTISDEEWREHVRTYPSQYK